MLETLSGHPYIVTLFDYVVDPSTKTPAIVSIILVFNSLDHGICEKHGVPHSLSYPNKRRYPLIHLVDPHWLVICTLKRNHP